MKNINTNETEEVKTTKRRGRPKKDNTTIENNNINYDRVKINRVLNEIHEKFKRSDTFENKCKVIDDLCFLNNDLNDYEKAIVSCNLFTTTGSIVIDHDFHNVCKFINKRKQELLYKDNTYYNPFYDISSIPTIISPNHFLGDSCCNNQTKQSNRYSTLTKDEINEIIKHFNPDPLQMTNLDLIISKCNHMTEDGSSLEKLTNGRMYCTLCHESMMKLDDITEEKIKSSIDCIVSIIQWIKYMNTITETRQFSELNVLYSMIPYLNKLEEFWDVLYNNYYITTTAENTNE